jgi:hypothetical protein
MALAKEEEVLDAPLDGEEGVWPNHTYRKGFENGIVINEWITSASGEARGAGEEGGSDMNTRRRGAKMLGKGRSIINLMSLEGTYGESLGLQ